MRKHALKLVQPLHPVGGIQLNWGITTESTGRNRSCLVSSISALMGTSCSAVQPRRRILAHDLKEAALRDHLRPADLFRLKNSGPEMLTDRPTGISGTIALGRQNPGWRGLRKIELDLIIPARSMDDQITLLPIPSRVRNPVAREVLPPATESGSLELSDAALL